MNLNHNNLFINKELEDFEQIQDLLIEIKDSTIIGIEAREKKKEEWYIENGQKMAKENAKLKRQKKTNAFLGGGIGAIIGILIGLLL